MFLDLVQIKVSGEEGQPITFAAAPGAQVVIKASEIVKGQWSRLTDDPSGTEPYPGVYQGVWAWPGTTVLTRTTGARAVAAHLVSIPTPALDTQ